MTMASLTLRQLKNRIFFLLLLFYFVLYLREDVMSVSGGITPHLITKLIQIFPVVTLNDIFVTLNVTLNQSQIMSIV